MRPTPTERPEVSVVILRADQQGQRYEVRVGGGVPRALGRLADGRDRVALVSCRRVLATPFGRRVRASLARLSEGSLVLVLPDGERGKNLSQIERAAGRLLRAGATRRSLLVALGGGAVTDAAGFLAATFMRGVSWVAVPTTLLAMVDAALGGKTGVNLPFAKNALGAFHPPMAVLSDPASLDSLPERERRSGLGEVVKYGALRPSMLPRVAAAARSGAADPELIAACARIKMEIVARDPKEQGERKLLNLGHTFGHGVEAAGGFSTYSHGEAVAVGLLFAFRLARTLGRLGAGPVAEVEEVLRAAGLPTRVPPALARKAAGLMGYDKKRTAAGLQWVLPRGRGPSWKVEWDVAAEQRAIELTVKEIGGAP